MSDNIKWKVSVGNGEHVFVSTAEDAVLLNRKFADLAAENERLRPFSFITRLEVPADDVAALGRMIGQATRRKRGYISIPIEDAKRIHSYIKEIKNQEYAKNYRTI